MTDRDLLAIACEQFLGKSVLEIKAVVLQTLEGHLRSILGETFTTNIDIYFWTFIIILWAFKIFSCF